MTYLLQNGIRVPVVYTQDMFQCEIAGVKFYSKTENALRRTVSLSYLIMDEPQDSSADVMPLEAKDIQTPGASPLADSFAKKHGTSFFKLSPEFIQQYEADLTKHHIMLLELGKYAT